MELQKKYMENYEKKMLALRECFASHAEIEYLWDPTGKDSGFIDPNILSAGGFPFIFHTLLEQISVKRMELTDDEQKGITDSLQIAFPELAQKELVGLREIVGNSLLEVGNISADELSEFIRQLQSKATLLRALYTKDFYNRLKILFGSLYGIAWVHPVLWKTYRINKVRSFKSIAEQGKGISFFPRQTVTQIYEYMECFVATLGNIASRNYTTYDVEWESDFSYYVADSLSTNGITTKVLIDLHANTGLFSEIPLKAILAPYGNTQYMEVYGLMVHPQKSEVSKDSIIYTDKHITLRVTDSTREIVIDGKTTIQLSGYVYLAKETESVWFKQYAYLWEHFSVERYDKKNESHRKMYLSNLLNAKSAFFELLAIQEKKENMTIAKPKTLVSSKKILGMELSGFNPVVTVKDGGWCSTGGKHVHRKDLTLVRDFLKEVSYTGIVVQNYVPSILFYQQGVSLHGHIRKASMIGRTGAIAHAGYVLKLIAQEKGNSSGYKSHMMYFNESGSFVFGKEIGGAGKMYTRLTDENLITTVNLPDVFAQVKQEWVKAMYAVNKFILEEKIEDFASKMVKSGKLSERYLIKK